MTWRDQYKVHPAADVFPMMSDDELAKLGEDIKEHGQTIPVLLWGKFGKDAVLIDGRNRLEAMERVGILDDAMIETFHCKDPVTHIITLNIRRRHLTKQQQADLIIAAYKAAEGISRQLGEKIKRGRGRPSNASKAAAIATAAEHGISSRTVERSFAKAEGKTPKPKRRTPAPGTIIEIIEDDVDDEPETPANQLPASMRVRGFLHRAAESAEMALADDLAGVEITEEIVQAAYSAATAWLIMETCLQTLLEKRASQKPPHGRSEGAVDDPTPKKRGRPRK